LVSSMPSTVIVPRWCSSSRLMVRMNVDLPEPDAPKMTTTSPVSTVRSIPRRTCSWPNHLWTSRATMIGSLVTFSTYLWLLRNARTSLVSTYAYVNPVVAVTLGWIVLDEVITPRTLIAGGVILVAVALIVSAGSAARTKRQELLETAEAEAH